MRRKLQSLARLKLMFILRAYQAILLNLNKVLLTLTSDKEVLRMICLMTISFISFCYGLE